MSKREPKRRRTAKKTLAPPPPPPPPKGPEETDQCRTAMLRLEAELAHEREELHRKEAAVREKTNEWSDACTAYRCCLYDNLESLKQMFEKHGVVQHARTTLPTRNVKTFTMLTPMLLAFTNAEERGKRILFELELFKDKWERTLMSIYRCAVFPDTIAFTPEEERLLRELEIDVRLHPIRDLGFIK